MNKELFTQAVNFIIELDRKEHKLTQALQEYGGETDFMSFGTDHAARIAKWLEEVMGDDEGTISWWIWDCPDCGRADDDACTISYPDGEEYCLKTVEDLYNYLIECSYGKD